MRGKQVIDCVKKVVPVAFRTSLWFLKLMLPVSFFVMLLSYFDILPYFSAFASPLFTLLGLPGDAALVFITSIFTNIYTVIALMSTLDFSVREGVILAVMCLISHNYLVETLVQKKTGSSGWTMVILRFVCSFAAAALLNLSLPDFSSRLAYQSAITLSFADNELVTTKLSFIFESSGYYFLADDCSENVRRVGYIEKIVGFSRTFDRIDGVTTAGCLFMVGWKYLGVSLWGCCFDGLYQTR